MGFHASRRGLRALALALLVTGILWMLAAGAGRRYEGWLAGGIVIGVLAVLLLLISLAAPRPLPAGLKNWQDAGLVISPLGLALVQGNLKGRMRWDELRDVRYEPAGRSFRLSSSGHIPGLQLHFEGAVVMIADIYDRPLPLIEERIRAYWQ